RDDRLARWTVQRLGFGLRHKRLDDAGDQVVVVRFGDHAADKLARHQLLAVTEIVDVELAVDLGSMHLRAAFPQQIALLRWTHREHLDLLSDELRFLALADLALNLHQAFAAALDLPRRNLFAEVKGFGAFFVGIAEDTEPIKLCLRDEIAKLFEVFLRLSGE